MYTKYIKIDITYYYTKIESCIYMNWIECGVNVLEIVQKKKVQ